jgi:hypothetical protein
VTTERRIAALRAVAVFGVVAAALVAVVAWWFVADLERNLDQSLTIGEDAATTLTETIDVADDVVASLDAGLGTLDRTLAAVDGSIGDTANVAESTADLAATLPQSFDRIDDALVTVESIGATIDGALRAVSALPIGPDYSPSTPFPDAVAELRAAFAPIGDELDAIATELAGFAEGSGDLRGEISAVRFDLQRTKDALSDSGRLLDRYRATAEQAGSLAASSRSDLDRSATTARIAALVVALLVLVSQCIPWWLADHLEAVGAARVAAAGDDPGLDPRPELAPVAELHDTPRR